MKIKSPSNYRDATPQVCATCQCYQLTPYHFGRMGDWGCTRPGSQQEESYTTSWFKTCDLWKLDVDNYQDKVKAKNE